MQRVVVLVLGLFLVGCGIAYRMPTEGMRPTITPDDLCVANPFAYSSDEVQRFDLVVFRPNEEQRKRFGDDKLRYLFRIIGLPNEELEIRDNSIFINGKLLEEPFEKVLDADDRRKSFSRIKVPENEYFLLGDNRPNSEDSRYWAKPTIHRDAIYSKVVDIKKEYYKAQ